MRPNTENTLRVVFLVNSGTVMTLTLSLSLLLHLMQAQKPLRGTIGARFWEVRCHRIHIFFFDVRLFNNWLCQV